MRIEFDPKKAAGNLKKHGVPFDEAASCLLDPIRCSLRGQSDLFSQVMGI